MLFLWFIYKVYWFHPLICNKWSFGKLILQLWFLVAPSEIWCLAFRWRYLLKTVCQTLLNSDCILKLENILFTCVLCILFHLGPLKEVLWIGIEARFNSIGKEFRCFLLMLIGYEQLSLYSPLPLSVVFALLK